MQRKHLNTLVAAILLVSTSTALALEAELQRSADDKLLLTWQGASGPVDVSLFFHGDDAANSAELVSARDADGRHEQQVAGKRPYFLLQDAEGTMVVAERVLPLAGGNNFRDLGGYRTADGRMVKWGTLYRSGSMVDLTDADYHYLQQLGIAVVCDLRSTEERHSEPTRWKGSQLPERIESDYELEVSELYQALAEPGAGTAEVMQVFADFYRDVPANFVEQYRAMFAALLAGKAPLAFNCSAGKDRTGVGAALLLSALGVPRDVVIEDYLLSNRYYRPRATQADANDSTSRMLAALPQELVAVLMGVDAMYLEATFEAIEARHGSVEAYLDAELGVDAKGLDRLRALYTE